MIQTQIFPFCDPQVLPLFFGPMNTAIQQAFTN